MRKCSDCGFEFDDDKSFCPSCGKYMPKIKNPYPIADCSPDNAFIEQEQQNIHEPAADIFDEEKPETSEEKKKFLKRNGIALWDVIESCEIKGSSDASVKDVKVNDIGALLKKHPSIGRIFVNGKTAQKLYDKHILPKIKISAEVLPSTSPANAGRSEQSLTADWKIIRY